MKCPSESSSHAYKEVPSPGKDSLGGVVSISCILLNPLFRFGTILQYGFHAGFHSEAHFRGCCHVPCQLSNSCVLSVSHPLSPPSAQEALKTGHFVRVLEVLMQLQRICNHPDLIQPRDTHSSYMCQPLQYNTPSLLLTALQQDQWKVGRGINLMY